MKHLARLFDIRFLVIFLFSFSMIFLLPSCEEQIDELWDNDDDSQNVSPLVGDWYADSIKSFYSCVKTLDSTSNVIADSYIENYNLWLLSDGSTQLYFDQSVNLQSEISEIPDSLGKYNLEIGKDNKTVEYTYDVNSESTGITNLLKDLKDAGLKLQDLKTEQTTLEKIFVNLVKENNEI